MLPAPLQPKKKPEPEIKSAILGLVFVLGRAKIQP